MTPDRRNLEPHEIVLSPSVRSAVAIEACSKFAGTVDPADLVNDLRERIKKVQGGDMQPVEAMLFGQAKTLETIFTSLARRATSQEYLKQFQAYLGMALMAQAQCRATLEALAEIKNPRPVAFVKQANIGGGHQQVNNGAWPQEAPPLIAGGDVGHDNAPRTIDLGGEQETPIVRQSCRRENPEAATSRTLR